MGPCSSWATKIASRQIDIFNGLCLRGQATKLLSVVPESRTDDATSDQGEKFRWGEKPANLRELEARAARLAGLRLGDLAEECRVPVPPDLKRAKGWVGGLMETALGASAASRAEPDFPELGVELKSLPVDAHGKPVESTFVCTIELAHIAHSEWEESRLWHKLGHVLWIVVEGTRSIPVYERRVGTPFFWIPSEDERALIRRDWEKLTLLIAQGRTSEITGHLGEVLQVRPKAARGSSRRRTFDEDGALYDEQPKGFYLRASFTGAILAREFRLPM